jgi:hypothetical protein
MDSLLEASIVRLNPNSFLGLDGLSDEELAQFNFVGILGPIYRLDILLRKAQWIAGAEAKKPGGGNPNLALVDAERFLDLADSTHTFLTHRLKPLLDRWPYLETLGQRKEMLDELKTYFAQASQGSSEAWSQPPGSQAFQDQEWRKAYQCYNCHRRAGY